MCNYSNSHFTLKKNVDLNIRMTMLTEAFINSKYEL